MQLERRSGVKQTQTHGMMFQRVGIIFAVVLSTGAWGRAQDFLYAHYAPPDVVPEADNHLAAIAAELNDPADGSSILDAAQRFETYLRESVNGLIGTADGSEVWVDDWIQKLGETRRKSLAGAMQKIDGAAAQQALDDVRSNPAADPVDACIVAHRYPLTTAATDAVRLAAQRSLALGDAENAEALTALAENSTPRVPNVIGQRVPFAAPWFASSLRSAWTAMRSWPVYAGGNLYVAGPTQVVAIGANASVLWRGPLGEGSPAGPGASNQGAFNPGASYPGASNPAGFTRGPALIPALFSIDATQPPTIVVVRQPPVHGMNWTIRALRGSDGQLLWSSESSGELSRLSFASTPVIAGRYVYAFGGELGDELDRLSLIALELTTGQPLWRCDLGSISHPLPNRHGKPIDPSIEPYRPWMNQTSPALSGDSVILAPDVGAVMAIDRFDGLLQWLHPYTPIGLPVSDAHRSALDAVIAARAALQNHRVGDPVGLPIRWNNTPAIADQTVVVAPQDSASVLAYSLSDGKPLWDVSEVAALNPGKLDSPSQLLNSFTLVGIRNKLAILQGPSLLGLALDDGHVADRSSDYSVYGGPALIRDEDGGNRLLVAGKERGVFGYNDLSTAVPGSTASFNDLLRYDTVRKALQASDAITAFTLPK